MDQFFRAFSLQKYNGFFQAVGKKTKKTAINTIKNKN